MKRVKQDLVAGVDTGSSHLAVTFLNRTTLKGKTYLHNIKVNNPALGKEDIPEILEKEIVGPHRKYFKRCKYVAFERNHMDVCKEVKHVALILPGVIKGASSETKIHWMNGAEVRGFYKIAPHKSHAVRKARSKTSGIFSGEDLKVLEKKMPKIDDVCDATNVLVACYAKSYMDEGRDWKDSSLKQVFTHMVGNTK